MKMHISRKRLLRSFIAATCLLPIFILTSLESTVCSWDYLIWMPHSEQADPLYRFVRNGKAGYIDRSGKVVIEPKFEFYGNYGGEFRDGLMEIGVSDGKYVDTTGKLVIDKGFYRGWDFSEGLAVAMRKDGEKWGYIDRTGEFVISPRFEDYPNGYVHSFSDGLAAIEVLKRYGYINRSGDFVIKPAFLHGSDFHDGMARVVVDGPCRYFSDGPCPEVQTIPEGASEDAPACKYTFIDKSGSIITGERYDRAKDFSEGFAPVRTGGRWGFIDKKGRMAIKPQFDEADRFSDGLALIRQNGLNGYIDHTGAIVITPLYKFASPFSEGLAVVGDRNGKEAEYDEYYYINKQGELAIPEKFDLASHFFKGLAHVKIKSTIEKIIDFSEAKGSYAYIDVTGKKAFSYTNER
jgi:WG containing repeat